MCCFFFFNDPATTEIYTLSLHDALPISMTLDRERTVLVVIDVQERLFPAMDADHREEVMRNIKVLTATARRLHLGRSEEHTSELQSRQYLVCRLLLEKKNTATNHILTRA